MGENISPTNGGVHSYQHLFRQEDSLTFLEIWNFEDPSDNITNTDQLDNSTAPKWIESQKCPLPGKKPLEGLRIIFSRGSFDDEPCHEGHEISPPLRMRMETYRALSNVLDLPYQYLRMLDEGLSGFEDVENPTENDLHAPGNRHFMFQLICPRIPFSVAISYEPERCITSALVHNIGSAAIPDMISEIMAQRANISIPLLIGTYFIQQRAVFQAQKVIVRRSTLLEIESQTGTRPILHFDRGCCEQSRVDRYMDRNKLDSVDFDRLTSQLTALSSVMEYAKYVMNVLLPVLDSFDHINATLISRRKTNFIRYQSAERRIRSEHSYSRASMQASLLRVEYISQRCQIQRQTVFSLIAQKDNVINMRDNTALKMISEDQRRLAVVAIRDSTAMRLLAMIATFFLPATFIATLLSTSFFDFHAPQGQSIVSPWLWIYFVIAIFLSAAIMAWWHIISKGHDHDLEKGLPEDNDYNSSTLEMQKVATKFAMEDMMV